MRKAGCHLTQASVKKEIPKLVSNDRSTLTTISNFFGFVKADTFTRHICLPSTDFCLRASISSCNRPSRQ